MKTISKILKVLVLILMGTTFCTGQIQPYRIHVDHVYPSSSEDYEKISKNLADLAKENKEEKGWHVLWTNDNRVISMTPVNGWEDLGEEFLPNTRAKLGDEKFAKLFEEFDEHYDTHSDNIIMLSEKYSYMPGGINISPEGQNYRKNMVLYHKARDRQKIIEIAGKFKELYTKKGSASHYRFYMSGFGNPEAYVLVSSSAESPLEHAKRTEENQKLLGEDAGKLWKELSQYVTKMEHMEGRMMPELSYVPTKS
ncbi:hypothetical protein LB456_13145 [Psychroflexus sp. CAK57W]|uniref:hypothetical protein n=1 Tax=Psychroflexus curvus TaxID=2873595 RepID=UPI001CCF34A6|nr:hypothetical protein [Psychroflexus curvus]MBZ9628369.1 hypothetical protein [Psychroflexus curvus]MBZ9788407.1 hypothetical protein [Psychroflexus curvus]